jgi:isoprenylcysteine carboxyl methyltransferase (ICMT) family protein YpbQ
MASKSRRGRWGIPDPLHVELGEHHKKLLEVIWVVSIVAAIISVAFMGVLTNWSGEFYNVSTILILFLVILLAYVIYEKSKVKPKK